MCLFRSAGPLRTLRAWREEFRFGDELSRTKFAKDAKGIPIRRRVSPAKRRKDARFGKVINGFVFV
jgi:hypothetical protein